MVPQGKTDKESSEIDRSPSEKAIYRAMQVRAVLGCWSTEDMKRVLYDDSCLKWAINILGDSQSKWRVATLLIVAAYKAGKDDVNRQGFEKEGYLLDKLKADRGASGNCLSLERKAVGLITGTMSLPVPEVFADNEQNELILACLDPELYLSLSSDGYRSIEVSSVNDAIRELALSEKLYFAYSVVESAVLCPIERYMPLREN